MALDPQQRRRKRIEAATGYLLLDMHRQALEQLASIRPESTDERFQVCLLKGEAYRGLSDWPAAINEFLACEELQPASLEALMGLAWCYKRTDRLPDAIRAMQRAYQSHPDEPVVLYNLSCYFCLAGQKEQCLSWLGRAMRMQPDLVRLISRETDFDTLRDDPDFQRLLSLATSKPSP
jgi:tetratricopeptide (TPR) repeat protein